MNIPWSKAEEMCATLGLAMYFVLGVDASKIRLCHRKTTEEDVASFAACILLSGAFTILALALGLWRVTRQKTAVDPEDKGLLGFEALWVIICIALWYVVKR